MHTYILITYISYICQGQHHFHSKLIRKKSIFLSARKRIIHKTTSGNRVHGELFLSPMQIRIRHIVFFFFEWGKNVLISILFVCFPCFFFPFFSCKYFFKFWNKIPYPHSNAKTQLLIFLDYTVKLFFSFAVCIYDFLFALLVVVKYIWYQTILRVIMWVYSSVALIHNHPSPENFSSCSMKLKLHIPLNTNSPIPPSISHPCNHHSIFCLYDLTIS